MKIQINHMTFGLLLGGASIVAMTAVAAPAFAQEATEQAAAAPQADEEGEQAGLDAIVVTAQRRSQSLSDVPISVQVLSGDALQTNVVIDTRDLAVISPTVNFQSGASVANTSLSLRGVSSAATGPGFQPSTGVVIDGVSIYTQGEFVANLGDIERIEVLNGPQGTLFGKNSTAGVVNIVTKGPVDHFEGKLEGMVTTDDEVLVRGVLNVPLAENIAFRTSGFYQNLSPLIDNLSGRPGYVGQRSYGINAKLRVDVTPDIKFTLDGTYTHTKSSANQSFPIGPSLFADAYRDLTGIDFGRGRTSYNMDTPAQDIATSKRVAATLEWKASSELTVTSVTSYSNFFTDFDLDIDDTPAGASVGQPQLYPGSKYPIQYYSTFENTGHLPVEYKYWSQELRGNYESGPVSLVMGVFGQFVDADNSINQPIYLDGALAGATPGEGYVSDTQTNTKLKNDTISLFGDMTYSLADTVKVFGGLRYTHEVFDVDYARQVYFTPVAGYDPFTGEFTGDPVATYAVSAKKKIDNLSGRVGLQFEPTHGVNLYASYARGYKGPSADTSASLPTGRSPLVNPEKANAFEIGTKLQMLDNRVFLNMALFHETIKNIQANLYDPENTSTASFVLQNAGDLKTRGFEGDLTWRATSDLTFMGSLAYVKATYSNFSVDCNPGQLAAGTCPNDPVAGAQQANGFPAVGAPRWKYSVSANYDRELPGAGVNLFANVLWSWTDKIQYALNNDPATVEPSHGTLNASIGVKAPDGRWEVQIFGKNLTNDFYYSWLANAPVFGSPVGWIPRDFARYGGLRVTTRF